MASATSPFAVSKTAVSLTLLLTFFPSSFSFSCLFFFFLRKAPMRYVLEFFTVILPHPTKFCQYFILLIENFNLYSDEDGVKHIRIKSRPNKWHENDCPFCHKSCPAYDKHSSRPTTWRGLDWGGILVEVEYQTHRIICLEHGVYVAEVPWAYPGSRFTKDFDLTVAWFASYLPRSTTSYFMRVDWETVGRCVNRALHDLEPERSRRLDGLVNISIDKISYKKGHK